MQAPAWPLYFQLAVWTYRSPWEGVIEWIFDGGLWKEGWREYGRETAGTGGHFGGQCGNLVQWEHPRSYESCPSEDSE